MHQHEWIVPEDWNRFAAVHQNPDCLGRVDAHQSKPRRQDNTRNRPQGPHRDTSHEVRKELPLVASTHSAALQNANYLCFLTLDKASLEKKKSPSASLFACDG
jgi:hypothetical protein